jgi:hypothetical protein
VSGEGQGDTINCVILLISHCLTFPKRVIYGKEERCPNFPVYDRLSTFSGKHLIPCSVFQVSHKTEIVNSLTVIGGMTCLYKNTWLPIQ